MGRYVLYNHGGSENHGCEALVRTAVSLLGKENVSLLSDAPEQDAKYHLDKLIQIDRAINNYSKFSLGYIKSYIKLKRTGDFFDMDILPYIKALDHIDRNQIAVSIGGDNYCYDFYPKFIRMHQRLVSRGVKTVLFGCSLEENLFEDQDFLNDMRSYSLITARESITYNALKTAGLKNIAYCPDSAFLLKSETIELPERFQMNNTVGLNISPLVLRKSHDPELIMDNYRVLIKYVLEHSNKSVALIPHVCWKDNDDSEPLSVLYEENKHTNRVVLLPDMGAEKIKYCISKCSEFIGARTHATIAAYSSCVPTIVLGYSVKSRGIAKDLFDSDKHYVIPYENIRCESDLLNEYVWLMDNKQLTKTVLSDKSRGFVDKIHACQKEIKQLVGIEK